MSEESKIDGAALRGRMMGEGPPFSGSPYAPDYMRDFIQEHIFGDVWQRNAIDLKTRSLCTIVAIVAGGPEEGPLKRHVQGAIRNGASTDEVLEVIVHTAFYAGFPKAATSMGLALQALDEIRTEI
jgi:4-carboxymuconolactone decarboxylase